MNKRYNDHRQDHFICFKDNDIKNDSQSNIDYESFKDAIKKMLTCNWTWRLNDRDINYVNHDWEYFINY